jgi:hypothetical protein
VEDTFYAGNAFICLARSMDLGEALAQSCVPPFAQAQVAGALWSEDGFVVWDDTPDPYAMRLYLHKASLTSLTSVLKELY